MRRPIVPPALLLAALLGTTTGAAAQRNLAGYDWALVGTPGAGPAGRRDAGLVYDRARGRLLVFGGRAAGSDRDDVWSLTLATRRWRQLATSSPSRPLPRRSMVAGLDETRDRLLITVGQGASFYNDVWALDLASEIWSDVSPPGPAPNIRYGSGGGIYILPGRPAGPALYLSHGFTDINRLDDAWAFDLATDTWSDVSPAGTRPINRCVHAASMLDADRLVLFGGCASGFGDCPLDDAWLFDDSADTWTEISSAGGPSARTFPAMAALDDGRTLLVFAGSVSGVDQNDLWLLDSEVPSWSPLLTASTPPAVRQGAAMVWVDDDGDGCGAAWIYGGWGGSDHGDVWRLAPPIIAPPQLLAVRRGDEVELSWPEDVAARTWQVWRGDGVAVTPGDPTATLLTEPIAIAGGRVTVVDSTAGAVDRAYAVRGFACAR